MADELQVRIVGSTDEMLSVARTVSVALSQAGIASQPEMSAPAEGMKGDAVAAALTVKLAAQTAAKLMDVLTAVFKRPRAPLTEIEIQTKDRKVRLKFNPATLSPSDINSIVRTINRGLQA